MEWAMTTEEVSLFQPSAVRKAILIGLACVVLLFEGSRKVEAQQAAGAYRVGFVSPISPGPTIAAFRQGAFHLVHAANADTARTAHAAFERTWNKRCPGVLTSLQEGGDELVTFFPSPTCSGQRCEPRTRLSGSTRTSDDA
jgi:hypothetical protein